MYHPLPLNAGLLPKAVLTATFSLALGACSQNSITDTPDADPALAVQATINANAASVATHPLCNLLSFAEVSAVAGGTFNKLDVIDADDMHSVDCVYLDMSDLYNGVTIRFVTTEKLVTTASKWRSASAYFEEWGQGGSAVDGIGARAVWANLLGGLLVLQGDHAIQLNAAKLDPADPAARMALESLAQKVVARLP